MMKAAVVTISDSVCAGKRIDRSGPAVRERLEQLGWSVPVTGVVPDEADEIGTSSPCWQMTGNWRPFSPPAAPASPCAM